MKGLAQLSLFHLIKPQECHVATHTQFDFNWGLCAGLALAAENAGSL